MKSLVFSAGQPDDKAKAVELAKLVTAFPQQGQDQVGSDLRAAAYFEALDGLPAWAVAEARQRIVAGKTAFGRPWGPGPIEFADLVRDVMKPWRNDLADLQTILAADHDREPTADERQRVVAGFEDLRASFGGGTSHQVYEDAMAGLKHIAADKGLDFRAAMDRIPDQPEGAGAFHKLPVPSTGVKAA